MRSNPVTGLALIGAVAVVLAATAVPQHVLAADDSKTISDGAAKGQANEGVAQPSSGGTGQYLRKKLPGRMKSGTLTVTRGAAPSAQDAGKKPPSNNMIGNHKD